MNWDRVEGQWKEFKGRAQQRWGKLTDNDLEIIDGKREELVGRLQKRYGERRDNLESEVDEWVSEL
jgi:uncharacterized protein YjbJ (UPF0337 family)